MNFTYKINHPLVTHVNCERSVLLRWVWLIVTFDNQHRDPIQAAITDDFGNLQEIKYTPINYRD